MVVGRELPVAVAAAAREAAAVERGKRLLLNVARERLLFDDYYKRLLH
jgi:hypothetical protein